MKNIRLILLSKYFTPAAQAALTRFTGKANSEIKLAFSSNAADSDPGPEPDQEFIQLAREELLALGYQLIDLDLTQGRAATLAILKQVDATFFTGGSVFRLAKYFQELDLTESYLNLLEQGLIHIGFSAGALICSDSLAVYRAFDADLGMGLSQGLGLYPKSIIPHYGDKPKYTEIYDVLVRQGVENVVPLSNREVIVVEEKA